MSDFSYLTQMTDKSMLMPKRPERSCKGDFGRVLCICGSLGMSGAAYFAAKAAYRTGAGLVEIFTSAENLTPLQTLIPEAVMTVYRDEIDREQLERSVERADVLVIGCGLGISAVSKRLLSESLRLGINKKKVIDADALNLLAKNPSLLKYAAGSIITPHPGEMSRLTKRDISDILGDISGNAMSYARTHSLICVLKDHNTAVSDGERVYINKSGNSGMATGGSGDVLAGIIGGILAQSREKDSDLMRAAVLGVYLHGLAGDRAAGRLSEYSVMASDIIDELPNIFKN